jgi:hypothetical protein
VPAPVSLRRKVQRADQGDELDIHSVYRGDLSHAWTRRRRTQTRSRMSVRLVALLGGAHTVKAEELFWRGAAVAKLAELLEESSYRVEIIAATWAIVDAFSTPADTCEVGMAFVVKGAGDPLEVDQLAGVVCNAGFFRTHEFRSTYAAPTRALRKTQVGRDGKQIRLLGRTVDRSDLATKEMQLDADGTKTITVPTSVSSLFAAREWIKEVLEGMEQE